MKELRKLIDVKSIVTLVLLATLVFVTATNRPMGDNVFLLFSNVTTMVFTYFFTKKKDGEGINNVNLGEQGDLNNGSKGSIQEE